jgi:hypothetical protein
MSQSRKRVRKAPTLTRLPRRGYVIQEKHLRRFRSLAVRPGATYAGLVHMGEDGNEIWVEAGLSDAEKRFTIVHELVHARRQRAGEELIDDSLEEALVELETIARVRARTLQQMPFGIVLRRLHDYLTGNRRYDPDTRAGLRAVYRRIWILLARGAGRRLPGRSTGSRCKRPSAPRAAIREG